MEDPECKKYLEEESKIDEVVYYNNFLKIIRKEESIIEENEKNRQLAKELFQTLEDEERECIERRFCLKDGFSLSLEEVGLYLNMTHARVRQIEASALRKIRESKEYLKIMNRG